MGVAMPRVDAGAAAGVHVPGAYEALWQLERERNGRDDRIAAPMMAEHGFCYRRGRRLAERLEAGETVAVERKAVELALWHRDRPAQRVRLPFDRAIRFVEIAPNDRITPTADLAQSFCKRRAHRRRDLVGEVPEG